jgi:2-C-methyl-D-erythritol 2,4-cyclodiphosphate synthase
MRVGMGFDVHPFDSTRPLVLGGVSIEGAPGLEGWSDADALTHAIADALLGAGGLGDIGHHFPKNRVEQGVSSQDLLSKVAQMVQAAGYRIGNLDATVIVQKVLISPHRTDMETQLAKTLGIDPTRVNIKATTTDGLGFAGRAEGIAAMAVALIEPS